jgi:hypothetical protein
MSQFDSQKEEVGERHWKSATLLEDVRYPGISRPHSILRGMARHTMPPNSRVLVAALMNLFQLMESSENNNTHKKMEKMLSKNAGG